MGKTLYLDMDEILVNFLGNLIEKCNEIGIEIKLEDIKSWELINYIGEKGIEIFQKPNFFIGLKPIDGAIETVNKLLDEEWEIFIISSPQNEYSAYEKYLWIKEWLPRFDVRNLILVGNKGDLLKNLNEGVLFDDCGHYIESFQGIDRITVCKDMPYNQGIECDFRVSDWDEFYEVVSGLR